MFDSIGWGEIVVLALAALFIFGPERLPGLAKDAAAGLKKVREAITGVREQVNDSLGDDLTELRDLDLRKYHPKTFIRQQLFADDDDDPPVRRRRRRRARSRRPRDPRRRRPSTPTRLIVGVTVPRVPTRPGPHGVVRGERSADLGASPATRRRPSVSPVLADPRQRNRIDGSASVGSRHRRPRP